MDVDVIEVTGEPVVVMTLHCGVEAIEAQRAELARAVDPSSPTLPVIDLQPKPKADD